jgi:hypothetical protein
MECITRASRDAKDRPFCSLISQLARPTEGVVEPNLQSSRVEDAKLRKAVA